MRRRSASLLAALALAACSGGGSNVAPRTAPMTGSGTLSLTVHYSALHQAASLRRSPQFVDGGIAGATPELLAFASASPSGANPLATAPVTVAPNAQGEQTYAIVAPATSSGTLNVVEKLAEAGDYLAEATVPYTLSPGAATNLDVTLDMVPGGIFIASSINPLTPLVTVAAAIPAADETANVLTVPADNSLANPIVLPGTFGTGPYIVGPTDAIGGFANAAGITPGVIPSVSLVAQSSPGTTAISTLIAGIISVTCDAQHDPVNATFQDTSTSQGIYDLSVQFKCQ